MGNDTSAQATTNDDCKEEKKDQAQIDHDKKMEKENERFKKIWEAAEKSMATDEGMPNLIDNYAKLRTMSEPKLGAVSIFVETMNDGWECIMKQLPDIRKKCGEKGEKAAAKMKKLHTDYWTLLLLTSNKVGKLLTECELQKDNIQDLMEIIEESYKRSGKIFADDKEAYKSDIKKLGAWIKTEVISDLMEEWKKINERLDGSSKDWEELATKAAAYDAKRTMKTIGKMVVGTLIIIGVIVAIAALVIVTAGAAGVAGAGAMGVGAAVAETAAVVSTTAVVSTAVIAGSTVAIGAAYLGYRQVSKIQEEKIKIQNGINTIIQKLDGMFKTGKMMEEKLSDFKGAQDNAEYVIDYFKDEQSYRKMKQGLAKIDKHLTEYIKQGNEVMAVIKQARDKYVESL